MAALQEAANADPGRTRRSSSLSRSMSGGMGSIDRASLHSSLGSPTAAAAIERQVRESMCHSVCQMARCQMLPGKASA